MYILQKSIYILFLISFFFLSCERGWIRTLVSSEEDNKINDGDFDVKIENYGTVNNGPEDWDFNIYSNTTDNLIISKHLEANGSTLIEKLINDGENIIVVAESPNWVPPVSVSTNFIAQYDTKITLTGNSNSAVLTITSIDDDSPSGPLYDIIIQFSSGDYSIETKIWQGTSNEGEPDVSYSLSPGDVRTWSDVEGGDYVVKISNGYEVETNTINIDSDCTIEITFSSQYVLSVNWCW